ncbi:MAG TPA: hypothetical protein VLG11_05255 [Candidatus Saccharimonadales bacterium]|nr:hypothetical protein [Candidatus Saccharimonadales bacterium]
MKSKRGQQIPVQRPMIFDVLPPDVAPRLDIVRHSRMRWLTTRVPRRLRHWWIGAGLAILLAGGILLVWRPWQPQTVALPKDVTNQITDFTPYFFSGATIPQRFTVHPKDVSFSSDVLFVGLHDPAGVSVVISEQMLPPEFSNDKPQGDQTVTGTQGAGSISSRDNRVIGTLFTSKSPRALITVSASDTVPATTIKSLMLALRPISN